MSPAPGMDLNKQHSGLRSCRDHRQYTMYIQLSRRGTDETAHTTGNTGWMTLCRKKLQIPETDEDWETGKCFAKKYSRYALITLITGWNHPFPSWDI